MQQYGFDWELFVEPKLIIYKPHKINPLEAWLQENEAFHPNKTNFLKVR